jgi:carboxypeptidase C (cathepsin A)
MLPLAVCILGLGLLGLCVKGFTVPSPSDYLVTGLDAYGNTDELHAGYMPLTLGPEPNDEGAFFFILAKARKPTSRLVVWLNGGPGCSSMVGFMWENGPFTAAKDNEKGYVLTRNAYAWNEEANMLFVEQPIRTGYSTATRDARIVHNEAQVSEDMYKFLTAFLTVFNDYQSSEIYISGESYAGMYIPYMAAYVVKKQAKQKLLGAIHINLQGVAIGNGAIDPLQDLSYSEYAYMHGLIPLLAKEKIDRDAQKCYDKATDKKNPQSPRNCDIMAAVLDAAGRPNEYDTGTFKEYTTIVQPGGVFDQFFNDPVIQEALHVRGAIPGINFVPETGSIDPETSLFTPGKWQCCNDDINEAFSEDFFTSVPALHYLSETPGFRVLLYSGERDLNTNFLGTLHTLESQLWMNRPWSSATRSLWRFQGDVAGEHMTLGDGKFSFLIVRNSGHLLPMDIPAQALDMLQRFLNNASFADVPLPSEESYGKHSFEGASQASSTQQSSFSFATLVLIWIALVMAVIAAVIARSKTRGGFVTVPTTTAYTTTAESFAFPAIQLTKVAVAPRTSSTYQRIDI